MSKRYKKGDKFAATLVIKNVNDDDENNYYQISCVELGIDLDDWATPDELDEAFNPVKVKQRLQKEKSEIEAKLKKLEGVNIGE